ncbi:MAG: IS1595 family transposase [Polyangiales bacterium]
MAQLDVSASLYQLTEQYPDEASAIRYFEKVRWPKGVWCPRCQSRHVVRQQSARNRGLWFCRKCAAQFSVTSGTVMESTKLPLRKWLFAFYLMGSSKKGMSALQLARILKVTYRTAWHLCHRVRQGMITDLGKLHGVVESDETYIGGRRKNVGRGYRGDKAAVQTMVERGGRAKSVVLGPNDRVDGRTVGAKLRTHTDPNRTVLITDESPIYNQTGKDFLAHETVNHKRQQYVRKDEQGHVISTNTAEGFFANLKRQIIGTHHHTSKKHLPKYVTEYDYKYNTRDIDDGTRTVAAIRGGQGQRLTLFKSTSGKGESLFDREAPPAPKRAKPRKAAPKPKRKTTKKRAR